MTHKTELTLIIPNSEDLYSINCKVNPLNMQHVIIKTLFHCKILTCRLIIHTIKCCIASPSIQDIEDSIHVIVSKQFYLTGKLQKYLTHLKIQFTDPEPVHPKIYEACLKYTFTFKIGSDWNLIGKSFYLHGINFTPSPSTNIDAIEWNILYKDNDTKLQIIPMKVNLYPLNLSTLSVTPSILNNFIMNPNCSINSIDLTLFRCTWVYVLPKLTRAKLTKVSKILPDNSSFENYNVLRRHWKNMYSYRLPKSPHGMLFYEVVFTINPNQSFIYPDVCILSKIPEVLMCEDKNKVTSTFLKDLSTNVHSVCNNIIKIEKLYPKLSIEYLYDQKRKNDSNRQFNFDETESSFFKTPTEHGMKQYNENKMLSSFFTFKGTEKISTSIRSQSQQVLSIIDTQKKKKELKTKKDNSFISPTNEIPISQTVLPYENICSFYEIPSMHTTYSDWFAMEKQYTNYNEPNKNYEISKQKPIIKCVENVNFDVNVLKRIRTVNNVDKSIITNQSNLKSELNWDNNKKNLYEQNNSYNKFALKQENCSQELTESDKKELHEKSEILCSMNKSKALREEPKSLLLKNSKNENTKLSFDKLSILKSETQQFGTDDVDNSMNINSLDSSPSLLDAFNKQKDEYLHDSQSTLNSQIFHHTKKKTDCNESESLKPMTKRYESNTNNVSHSFLSKFDSKSKYERIISNNKMHSSIESNSSLFNIKLTDQLEEKSLHNLSKKFKFEESNEIKQSNEDFNENNTYLNKSQCSWDITEELMINKSSQKLVSSPIYNSSNKYRTVQELRNDKFNDCKSNEHQMNPSPVLNLSQKQQEMSLPESNVFYHKLHEEHYKKRISKTPSLSSTFNSNYESDNTCMLKNTSRTAIKLDEIEEKLNEKSVTNISNNSAIPINNKLDHLQYGDFLSILSESSNESQSDNYESCKLVFEEALTFENQQF